MGKHYTNREDAEIIAGRREGRTILAIAERIGRTPGSVTRRIERLGLPSKPPRPPERLEIRVTPKTRAQLDEQAEASGVPPTVIARRALKAYLETHQLRRPHEKLLTR